MLQHYLAIDRELVKEPAVRTSLEFYRNYKAKRVKSTNVLLVPADRSATVLNREMSQIPAMQNASIVTPKNIDEVLKFIKYSIIPGQPYVKVKANTVKRFDLVVRTLNKLGIPHDLSTKHTPYILVGLFNTEQILREDAGVVWSKHKGVECQPEELEGVLTYILTHTSDESGVYFWSDKGSTLKQITLVDDKLVFKPYLDTHNKLTIISRNWGGGVCSVDEHGKITPHGYKCATLQPINKCVILPTDFNPQAPVERYDFHTPIELLPYLTTKGETL